VTNCDVAIIGGGIVGLATADALTRTQPGLDVIVVEKETDLATHQTGRNSGVIHAGLYYEPGSLKARLCTEGGRRLLELCDAHGIEVGRFGKVVVATDPTQIPALDELERRAQANGVIAERMDSDAITEREPHVRGVAGLWVPVTAVVNFAEVAKTYARLAEQRGARVLTGFEVVDAASSQRGRRLESPAGWIDAKVVVNCAGLHVDRLARMMGLDSDVSIVPFRGEYRDIRGRAADLVRGLVYPVPDPRFPFLGVHFTRGLDGRVEAGPNAVLALAREGYRRRDMRLQDVREIAGSAGLRNLARAYWRTGSAELWRSVRASAFVRDAARLIPALTAGDLGEYRSGVRAQAMRSDGTLVHDFVVEETSDAIHVLNAPSPAATASLAIGDHIAARVVAKLAG
jgi:L-2-hydroxyglutarate oxidase